MKTILITGGAGFIGSNFVNYLFNKYPEYKIIVIDALTYAGNLDNFDERLRGSDRFEFWYGDIVNNDLMDNLVSKSDIVFHFAAETHVAKSISYNKHFFETDVLGTHSVANAVLENKDRIEKLIHISTSEVYGTAIKDVMDEEHPLNPCSPYAAAKAGADRLMYSYYYTYDLPITIIRPFNQYGPRQHIEKAIPRFITRALRGKNLELDGGGVATRDWVFVEDTIQAFDRLIKVETDKIKGEVINLGSGSEVSVKDIATKIVKKLDLSEDRMVVSQDRPGQVQNHISSTKKAKDLLDWKVTTDISEGLDKTIDWYSNNQNWWKKSLWLMDSKQSKVVDPHYVIER